MHMALSALCYFPNNITKSIDCGDIQTVDQLVQKLKTRVSGQERQLRVWQPYTVSNMTGYSALSNLWAHNELTLQKVQEHSQRPQSHSGVGLLVPDLSLSTVASLAGGVTQLQLFFPSSEAPDPILDQTSQVEVACIKLSKPGEFTHEDVYKNWIEESSSSRHPAAEQLGRAREIYSEELVKVVELAGSTELLQCSSDVLGGEDELKRREGCHYVTLMEGAATDHLSYTVQWAREWTVGHGNFAYLTAVAYELHIKHDLEPLVLHGGQPWPSEYHVIAKTDGESYYMQTHSYYCYWCGKGRNLVPLILAEVFSEESPDNDSRLKLQAAYLVRLFNKHVEKKPSGGFTLPVTYIDEHHYAYIWVFHENGEKVLYDVFTYNLGERSELLRYQVALYNVLTQTPDPIWQEAARAAFATIEQAVDRKHVQPL